MKHVKILLILSTLFLMAGCDGTSDGTSGNSNSGPSSNSTATANTSVTGSTATTSGLPTVTIRASGGEKVVMNVEIADTEAEREKGLMGRTAMDEDHGMLFVFPNEQTLSFWMKDTLIPLSVAFMDSNGRIVDIQDMQPQDLTNHNSAEPARYALEVNQGFFERHGVKVGDEATLPR